MDVSGKIAALVYTVYVLIFMPVSFCELTELFCFSSCRGDRDFERSFSKFRVCCVHSFVR